MITYNRISQKDVAPIVQLGAEMHAESAFQDLEYCTEKVTRWLQRYINNPQSKFCLCAYQEDALIGMIIGDITPYFFGNETIATNQVWYVHKERRGTLVGVKLLKAFNSWAKENGVSEICIGISTALYLDRTHKLLSRMGFAHVGGTFKAKP